MQALFELTEGQRILEAIIRDFPSDSSHWNEAQNRFQFVDRLLIECLGWDSLDIEVEKIDGLGGKADYILGRPVKAVLEAKREAKLFEVPPTGSSTILRKIAPLLRTSKTLEDAVHQVIPYCAIHGAQIAVVCNGPQTAIFQALIPGQSPLEGECFFFNGFDSYVKNFSLLWKLLSPEGITENLAYKDLSIHRNPRIPQKACTSIPEPYKYRYRNQFQENLRSLSSLLLEEIEDNPTLKASFYEECYVPIEANNRHLLLSKNIIAARYKRVGEDGVAPSALEAVTVVDTVRGDLKFNDPAIVRSMGSRPIVVIGDVGVGKTSFFENLYQNLEGAEKANTYFIHINLGIKANLSTSIKSYILSEIPTVLKSNYGVDINSAEFAKAIYHNDLIDFDNSVKGALKGIDDNAYQLERIAFLGNKIDTHDKHLHASLGHLARGRNKQIILVLDNADQRTFEVQQETFLIAQELAASRSLLVFVALRPSTFYLSKTTGALSAYQNKILTIAPPPADEVVQKRLAFAVRVAEGKVAPAELPDIRLHSGSVVSFLNATLRSIRTSEPIRQFLSNITGGNTRAVIELITGFFGSPNVDSQKIVKIEEATGNYNIPLHEFTKHALLGEYAYFNSQSSFVACNIFDVSAADPREHFLASLIVAFLNSGSGVMDNDGFMNGQELMAEMSRHGFVEDQIRNALRRLATKRLIETPHSHYRELQVEDHNPPEHFHFRVTTVGIYHVRFWTGSFAFLDAVSTDTPIFDPVTQSEISKFASSFEICDRYQKAVCFRKYLETQWHFSNFGANFYDFVSLIQNQDESFLSVKRFVEQNKRKPYHARK
jgi:GTPase SAR1 family protein